MVKGASLIRAFCSVPSVFVKDRFYCTLFCAGLINGLNKSQILYTEELLPVVSEVARERIYVLWPSLCHEIKRPYAEALDVAFMC